MRKNPSVDELVSRAREGDARAVARLISWVEDDAPQLREVMAALAPYADRISLAGAAACFGPVSGYLAPAAATVGDRAAAAQYATAARDTATRWGWVAYVSWLDDALARFA